MNKLNKFILAALCLTLLVVVGYRVRDYVYTSAPKPLPLPTATIEPQLIRRAEKELSPQAIFRTVELKEKLRDRDAFMRECRTLSREQLLERVEDLARIAGDCEAELKDR
jgi:hypothetical protein